jgi:hypothetical protein
MIVAVEGVGEDEETVVRMGISRRESRNCLELNRAAVSCISQS